jgi:hypothetical protein
MKQEHKAVSRMLEALLRPWHEAVEKPAAAQKDVLHRLLADYARTAYGRRHGAANVETIDDYRRAFPVTDYEAFKPLIDQVMAGEFDLLLAEEPVGWAITRGTSKGESKFIPMTPTDLRQRVSAGRAMMQYVHNNGRYDLFDGLNLNLNFPSVVGQIEAGGRQIEYGYSLCQACLDLYANRIGANTGRNRRPRGQQNAQRLGPALRTGAGQVSRSKRHPGRRRVPDGPSVRPPPAKGAQMLPKATVATTNHDLGKRSRHQYAVQT